MLFQTRKTSIHQGFNRNFTKLREYFLYAKKTKITTLFKFVSSVSPYSAILENIRWTETAYALLCQPHTRRAVVVQIKA